LQYCNNGDTVNFICNTVRDTNTAESSDCKNCMQVPLVLAVWAFIRWLIMLPC